MRKNKLLLLSSSLGVLLLLIVAAVQENWLKPWREVQAAGRLDEAPIDVQLRQITNERLGVADRCVSCHVSMAPGEQAVKGAALFKPHPRVVHDPAEWGCTKCHGGQGSATEKDDAHGSVHFWPAPMIPIRFAQAGCGTCHSTPGVPGRAVFVEARSAFERLDCYACHRIDGRGGTIRPDGGGMEGPDLSRAAISGYDEAWHEKHIGKSEKAAAGPWRNSFAKVDDADLTRLRVFLATRVASPALIEAKATFFSFGCLGCHRVSGVGGDEGPDLTRAGEKDPGQADFSNVAEGHQLDRWIAEHFRSPVAVTANSQMPPVSASEREIDQLTMFVLSLRRGDLPGAYTPADRIKVARFGQREFSTDAATLFGTFCAGCHGPEGKGKQVPGGAAFPAIANPDYLSLVSDEVLTETIKRGRPGRRMPGWAKEGGLRPAEIAALVGHLRKLSGAEPAAHDAWSVAIDPLEGVEVYDQNCSGCHGKKGEGSKGPALNNRTFLELATDRYLVETVRRGRSGTAMAGFENASPTRRALSKDEIEAVVAYVRAWQGR